MPPQGSHESVCSQFHPIVSRSSCPAASSDAVAGPLLLLLAAVEEGVMRGAGLVRLLSASGPQYVEATSPVNPRVELARSSDIEWRA